MISGSYVRMDTAALAAQASRPAQSKIRYACSASVPSREPRFRHESYPEYSMRVAPEKAHARTPVRDIRMYVEKCAYIRNLYSAYVAAGWIERDSAAHAICKAELTHHAP